MTNLHRYPSNCRSKHIRCKTCFGIKAILGFLFLLFTILCPKISFSQTALSYNYSKISPHPRLLLQGTGDKSIEQAIKESADLKKVSDYIIETSENFTKEPPLVFKKEGKRLLAVSRNALKRLFYLSYAYRLSKNKKYLEKAEEELRAVCSFESWNPSHFLDVGEMTMGVAIAYDWLYQDLNQDVKKIVRKAILEKAFDASDNKKDAWFLDAHNNWNSVCNAGLVFGALAILDEEKEKSIAIIERAIKSNQLPLKAFGPDGNYPEGPSYWNYGATFQALLSAALESALGSDNGLSKTPGFMESAYYMLFSVGPSGFYYNYYDGGRAVSPSPAMFWFASKLKDPFIATHEIELIKRGAYTSSAATDNDRVLPFAVIFGKDSNSGNLKKPAKKMFIGHGITPVYIVRTAWENGKGKYLGIKGGKAGDAHAHMDQGTFVYDVDNLRWAMDFGLQSYITLESKGVDLWNMDQNSQRWDIFRYNNLNHNTLTINNQRHNINGKAEITQTYDSKNEVGAKINLTPALNLKNELKSATRKATIVDGDYLKIEDVVETNGEAVKIRWNMVTPATATIVDKKTIKLTQNGKSMIMTFEADIPFNLVIRPSEKPAQYKSEFGNYNYGDYNQENKGTVMVGFDTTVPAGKTAKFVVKLKEQQQETLLKKNTFVLHAPSPSTASEGDKLFVDISPFEISEAGNLVPLEAPDWTPYGNIAYKSFVGKTVKFGINAKRITDTGLINAGIDRSADGHLGVRGGEGNGIDKNEGYFFSFDLTSLAPTQQITLKKIALQDFDKETCTFVNRTQTGGIFSASGNETNKTKEIVITKDLKRKFVDLSELKIVLKGGKQHQDFLSLFNTGAEGNFRVAAFEFEVSEL